MEYILIEWIKQGIQLKNEYTIDGINGFVYAEKEYEYSH